MRACLPLLGLLAAVACSDPPPYAEAEQAYARGDLRAARGAYERALAQGTAEASRAAVRARLGLTLRKLGETAAAEQALVEAIAEAEAEGDGATAATARRHLGRLYADTGRGDEALAAYDRALAWHRAHGPDDELLRLQVNRAGLAWAQGRFEAAYEAYLDVHGRAGVAQNAALQAAGLDGLAMLLAYVGDFGNARDRMRQSTALLAGAGRDDLRAGSLANQAVVAVAEGAVAEAEALAAEALERATASGNAQIAAQARVVLAQAALAAGRDAEAAEAAHRAAGLAAAADFAPLVAESRAIEAIALARAGRWADLDAALDALQAHASGDERAAVLAGLHARRALARGEAEAAAAHLDEAIARYEALREAVGPIPLHHFFIPERAWAYETRIGLHADAGRAAEALQVVGRVKARAWTEQLVAAREPPAAVADRRRLERGLNVLALSRRAVEPLDPERLRATLPPDLAVIEYFALPDRLLVFWITRDAIGVVPVPAARAEVERRAQALVEAVRKGAADHLEHAAWLGHRLLDPVAARLHARSQIRTLCVVPHGSLHHVPFEALPWGTGLLVDAYPVFSVPGLSALARLLALPPPGAARSILAVGDPFDNLPGARHEAESVARQFPDPRILLGAAARESAVRAAMQGPQVLHFAVHGIRPAPDAPAYLELLPDSSDDGRLHADEVATQRLAARLVVLSVCDSGRGRANRGDEIVGVVDRAFLEAGARTVIASRWPVHDAASVLFMRRFYAGLKTRGALAAFHEAQLALRRGEDGPAQLGPLLASLDGGRVRGVRPPDPAGPPDFTHPYYWAGFSLRGDFR